MLFDPVLTAAGVSNHGRTNEECKHGRRISLASNGAHDGCAMPDLCGQEPMGGCGMPSGAKETGVCGCVWMGDISFIAFLACMHMCSRRLEGL